MYIPISTPLLLSEEHQPPGHHGLTVTSIHGKKCFSEAHPHHISGMPPDCSVFNITRANFSVAAVSSAQVG